MILAHVVPMDIDVYFSRQYGKLAEAIEGGSLECFTFENDLGCVLHQFLKRPIPWDGPGELCDLITPYGYGGPLVMAHEDRNREALIKGFVGAYTEFCRDAHVVSEFIRFHPIEKNHVGLDCCYDIFSPKKTLATNLQDYGPPLNGEFTAKRRRTIRKSMEAGVLVDLDFSCSTLEDFLAIYTNTMTRNEAKSFYYFDRAYFIALVEALAGNVFIANARLDGKIIASGVYLYNSNYIHAHLSGTLTDYLNLSPASALRASIAEWGHANGQHFFHHGGGYSNSPDDTLFQFKKSFCINTEFDFFLGRKIWDSKAYDFLTSHAEAAAGADPSFFPAYRSRQ